MSFNHFDAKGQAVMVDVSGKEPTLRTAVAEAQVVMRTETLAAIIEGRMTKGDVLGVARLAGIAAAKRTPELIPLSHPLAIHHAAIDFSSDPPNGVITVVATIRALERTGVEMEAMTAASVAALTVYDMCKGMDRGITIREVALLSKDGVPRRARGRERPRPQSLVGGARGEDGTPRDRPGRKGPDRRRAQELGRRGGFRTHPHHRRDRGVPEGRHPRGDVEGRGTDDPGFRGADAKQEPGED
ncbi:MAG: cyclohydrolase subunit MoaC, partial [Deltaproteobacteria bacterium]|nr:cyclohydrolase subunit MoaC [Deltaproteobacteria bacterium]